MFIWSTFKLRLATTFILNAVNPGSKCTKEVTPLEKITYSLAAAAMVGFYGAVRNRTEGSVAKFQLVVRRLLLFLFSKRFVCLL